MTASFVSVRHRCAHQARAAALALQVPLRAASAVLLLSTFACAPRDGEENTANVQQALAPVDYNALAQRFRPYMRFSTDQGDEVERPCSWQWFYGHANLIKGSTTYASSATLAQHPEEALRWADVRNWGSDTKAYAMRPTEEGRHGEPWANAFVSGHGFYAHVEPIDDRLVNIEYWALFGYNHATALPRFIAHEGDIVGVQLVYDSQTDRILTVTFSEHGQSLEQFNISHSSRQSDVTLVGKDFNGNPVSVIATRYDLPGHGQWQGSTAEFYKSYEESDRYVYMVHDPINGRPEHLAIHFEWGTHEPWPNPSGGYRAVPKHNGASYNFLPLRVKLFGPEDDPFTYFGGNIGEISGMRRHQMWLYNPTYVDQNDMNPYESHGPMTWPPVPPPAAACRWLDGVSEEQPNGSRCAVDEVVNGVACTGRYCDNVSIQCCPQPAAGPVRETAYFSEEQPGGAVCDSASWVVGVKCRGDNCDSMSLQCMSTGQRQQACEWTPFVSEEAPMSRQCPANKRMAGARCQGSYCDSISLFCCAPAF
jgi:hypothetical protein